MRIEIAYLQEEIESANPPKLAKFKIPVLMTDSKVSTLKTSNKNILNKTNGNLSGSPINLDDTIDLNIPLEYTFFYGAEKIPENTRFLVAFVGANVNDIKIIGRYDAAESNDIQTIINLQQDVESQTSVINAIKQTASDNADSLTSISESLSIISEYAQELAAVQRQLTALQKDVAALQDSASGGDSE
jgi:hypothetical protein